VVLRPEGGGAPVLRISTTSIVSPVKGRHTRHGKAILHYDPSTIINWRLWADTSFEKTAATGTWVGLGFELIGSWVTGPFPFHGPKLLSAGYVAKPSGVWTFWMR
jgi:hypothetical protein